MSEGAQANPKATSRGTSGARRPRLAVVVSHPIQYFSPLYRALANSGEVDLRVIYCSRIGLDRFHDPKMGVELAWNMDLLGGYDSVFLSGADRIKTLGWREFDNPDVGAALDTFDPQAVIINGYSRKTLLRALAWAKRRGRAAMLVADSTTDTSKSGAVRGLKRFALPMLLARYDAILTMSERGEEHFRRYGTPPERLFRVPTMMDESFWRARARKSDERRRIRSALGIPQEAIVLAAVGKIYDTKRVGDIVEAVAQLKRADLHLLVVGDGIERKRVEARAREAGINATFTGFVNIDALPAYYAAADILVHAASLEQFGMVAIEAAILGLPMILSDQVGAIGATSIARPGENALVYPCGDVAALATSIARLADEPSLMARMSDASLAISLDHDGRKSVAGVLAATECGVNRSRGWTSSSGGTQ